MDDIRIDRAEAGCAFAELSCADVAMVHPGDRADLHARPTQESLVGEIDFGTVNLPFDDFQMELVAHELQYRSARDSFQHVIGNRRSRPHAVSKHKEIRGRSL